MTIGEKIRIARHLRGYTQAELGSMVKLPGDMIRKYENDVRTPKPERLSLIAQKLDVDISSFSDINITSISDIMHIFFELEDSHGLKIEEKNGEYSLTFDNDFQYKNIQYALDAWFMAKNNFSEESTDSEEIKMQKSHKYLNWKSRYPMDIDKNEEYQLQLIQSTFKNKIIEVNNTTSISTFKDIMLIFENMIRTDIEIEFHIKTIGIGQGIAICIFKNSQLLSLTDEQSITFTKFLYAISELDKMGIHTELFSHTFQEETFSEYHIFNSTLEAMVLSLKDFKVMYANNTYEDITENYNYKDTLQKANVRIKDFI